MSYRLEVRNQKKGTYLIIEEKFRDKEKKQARTKHYKTLGYVHDLQKEFSDPVSHFKEIVDTLRLSSRNESKHGIHGAIQSQTVQRTYLYTRKTSF